VCGDAPVPPSLHSKFGLEGDQLIDPRNSVIRIGVLIVSDRSAAGERPDSTGPALTQALEKQGWAVVLSEIIPDDLETIQTRLADISDAGACDVVLTSGGTGFGHRDVTPEATSSVIDRNAPGIAESLRAASLKATPHAMLSRGVAGIRGQCLIVNLPGSPQGALDNLGFLLPVISHAVQLLRGDPGAEKGHQEYSGPKSPTPR
jgi:molybdenum cofactor synthesis domain-containing protein